MFIYLNWHNIKDFTVASCTVGMLVRLMENMCFGCILGIIQKYHKNSVEKSWGPIIDFTSFLFCIVTR